EETLPGLLAGLRDQAARTRAIVESHDLDEAGQLGDRWDDGADPATLERILFHLLQEYARHVGHLDIVTELATAQAGELSFKLSRTSSGTPPANLRGPRNSRSGAYPAFSATQLLTHSPRRSIQVRRTLPGCR